MRRTGFTLIELLIVVAIIAVLAAIAVPNFLEAQVRAKVSRVKNDQRTYATALEAYMVDNNRYPGDQDNDPFHPVERGFYRLTTPVSYITTLFTDPFSRPLNSSNTNQDNIAPFYVMASGADNSRLNPNYRNVQAYMLISVGPDGDDDVQDTDEFPAVGVTNPSDITNVRAIYDPTNGSVSNGDLLRLGGEYRQGPWTIENRTWRQWPLQDVMPN